MKINKDEPLPRHTEYDWEECYAKVVLENVLKEKFYDLNIIDKPDLQNEELNVGIECTVSINIESIEAEYLYSELTYGKAKNPDKCKERIKKLGGNITEYSMFESRTVSLNSILGAVRTKLKKLNGNGYKIFEKNYLFIRDCIYIPNQQIQGLQYLIGMIQSKHSIEFDKIYILLNSKLIELNMIDYTNKCIEFDSNTQYELAEKARNIVVEKEEKVKEKNDK